MSQLFQGKFQGKFEVTEPPEVSITKAFNEGSRGVTKARMNDLSAILNDCGYLTLWERGFVHEVPVDCWHLKSATKVYRGEG